MRKVKETFPMMTIFLEDCKEISSIVSIFFFLSELHHKGLFWDSIRMDL